MNLKFKSVIKTSLLGLIISALLFSFTSRKKEFVPPGTVKYNDTLFIDEAEISNFSWKEYEFWIKNKYGKNSPEHKAAVPDTLVWLEKYSYNEPYTCVYYWHLAYRDFPVVGISYEQVVEFCKWRTERVSVFMAISGKYKGLSIEYRLPTKYEWELLSFDARNVFENDGWDEKGKHQINTCYMKDLSKEKKQLNKSIQDVTAPVYSYPKSTLGLFNMIGNVSEMVLEKGISKGGGWVHQLNDCRVGKNIEYTKREAWLGFRCVCVVKRNKI